MGMSASQARLLSLTSRLHDIELSAQQIQSQKLALATQKDDVYEKYCEALDATTIRVAFDAGGGVKSFQDASFAALCSFSENRFRDYALIDARTEKMIVSEKMKEAYDNYGSDKYAFAWAMMGYGSKLDGNGQAGRQIGVNTVENSEEYAAQRFGYGSEESGIFGDGNDLAMTKFEWEVYNRYADSDKTLKANFENFQNAEETPEQREALKTFRDYLYSTYAKDIHASITAYDPNSPEPSVDGTEEFTTEFQDEFNYYTRMWDAINQAGGCVAIDPQYESGEAGNDWLNNMVSSGLVLIRDNDPAGKKGWTDTSVATSTNGNYLDEQQDDKDLKKAEAEYEHEMDLINRKDTKFDTELSKLETERKAITTQLDSIKSVKEENIDRTFGIFS